MTKCRKYDAEYFSMDFMCAGSEHEQQPQWVLCYKLLSNDAMKPSKLRRHLESKYEEHATKSIEFLKNKDQQLRQSTRVSQMKTVKLR
jgi:hypothetical protein